MPPPPTIQIGLTIGIVDQPNDIVHKWIFIFLNCELEGLVTVGLETQRARPGGVPDASFLLQEQLTAIRILFEYTYILGVQLNRVSIS